MLQHHVRRLLAASSYVLSLSEIIQQFLRRKRRGRASTAELLAQALQPLEPRLLMSAALPPLPAIALAHTTWPATFDPANAQAEWAENHSSGEGGHSQMNREEGEFDSLATPLYWAPNWTSGGSGTWDEYGEVWNTEPDGSGTQTTWVDGDEAVFGGDSSGLVEISGNVSANDLVFATDGYDLEGAAYGSNSLSLVDGTIEVDSYGAATIGVPLATGTSINSVGDGYLTVTSDAELNNLTVTNNLTLSGSIQIDGTVDNTSTGYMTLTSTCTMQVLGDATFDNQNMLYLNGGTLILSGSGYSGTIMDNSGWIDIDNHGLVLVEGSPGYFDSNLLNTGTIQPYAGGLFLIEDSGNVINSTSESVIGAYPSTDANGDIYDGNVTVESGGSLQNSGTLFVYGDESYIDESHHGTMTIELGGTFENDGAAYFVYSGELHNYGTATLASGSYTTSYDNGHIYNYGTMDVVDGTLTVSATDGYGGSGGHLLNVGTLSIDADSTVTANGDLSNPGSMSNAGWFAWEQTDPVQIALLDNSGTLVLPPTVATPASAASNFVTTTHVDLSVLGSDPAGESSLTYTWVAKDGSWSDDGGSNSTKNTTAYGSSAGVHEFDATITNSYGLYAISAVDVTFVPTITYIALSSSDPMAPANGTQQFTANAHDQFGGVMNAPLTWSVSGSGFSVDSHGLVTAGPTAGTYSVTAKSGSVSATSSYSQLPSIVHAAAGTVNSAAGTVALTMQATDATGGSDLVYTWSVTSGTAANVSFVDNDSATAKATTAAFAAAGSYTLLATATDSGGHTTTSSVSVTVAQALTSIDVLPLDPVPTAIGNTQGFAATAYDQFGLALTSQPTFTWSVTGTGYSINSSGVVSTGSVAGSTLGSYSVTATASSLSSDPLTFSQALTISTAPAATVDSAHITAALSVLASDSAAVYDWTLVGNPPGPVSFSDNGTNAAKDTTVTFGAVGSYSFLVSITDSSGHVTTAATAVTITAVLTSIAATASDAMPAASGTQHFTAVAYDQFGLPLASQPSFTWAVSGSGYSINSSTGVLTGASTPASYQVTATSSSVTSPALAFGQAPGLVGSISSSVNTSDGCVSLTAAAGDALGGSDLIYSWTVYDDAPGGVDFTDNGSYTAGSTKAYFTRAGTYHFLLAVTDANNLTTTSTATVTISQELTRIGVSTTDPTPAASGTQQFAAVAYDQFDQPMASQPGFTWAVHDNTNYSINTSTGLLTAGTTLGSYNVTAAASSVTSDAVHYSQSASIVSATADVDNVSAFADLTVSATDTIGGSDLVYTWSVTSGTAANVTFLDNETTTANATSALFSAIGSYTLTVTAQIPGGASTTSTVNVDITQALSSIQTLPLAGVPTGVGTQGFSAVGYDQFGDALTTQPAFRWAAAGTGYRINHSGVVSTGAVTGASLGGYAVAATFGNITSNPLSFNQVLTVATAPAATVDSTTHTTAALSIAGADPEGNSAMAYDWSVVGNAPGNVFFSDNGTNSAKDTTATFSAAGTYTLLATIEDINGEITTTTLSVTVSQVLTSIAVSSSAPTPAASGTQQFAAVANDQFGNPLTTQPSSFTWAVTGTGYSINSSGLLTAGSTVGSYHVTAASGSVTSPAAYYSQSLTIVNAAAGTVDTTSGAFANMTASATDATGGTDLTYTWSVTSGDATQVAFTDNASKTASATQAWFGAAGSYTLLATIDDGNGHTTTSSVSVTVSQILTGITVLPGGPAPSASGTQQFSAVAYDQFGDALTTQPSITWSTSTGYTISSGGLLTAGATLGSYSVTATSGTVASDPLPFSQVLTVATSAAATGDTTTYKTAALTVLGAVSAGESTLTYTWYTTSGSPGGVSISDNGTNSAKSTTATFQTAGTYEFLVDITDADGLETTSYVSITIDQHLKTIAVATDDPTPAASGTQQFTAIAYDQFDQKMTTQPTLTWSRTGSNYSINSSSGLLTAGTTLTDYTVTATSGSVSGSMTFHQSLDITSSATATLDSSNLFATLSVGASDTSGGTDLIYSWKLISGDAGNVVIWDNDSSTADTTDVDIYAAGTYTFEVTVKNSSTTVTSTTSSLTVSNVLTSIAVTTNDLMPHASGTQHFSALAFDQFAQPLATQPTFTWAVTGTGYSIVSSTGVLTAPSTVAAYSVTATAGSPTVTGTSGPQVPIVVTAAAATMNTTTGLTAALSVLGGDASGESNLIYAWFPADDNPASVDFSANDSNAAQSTTVTFNQAGTYNFTVTISNINCPSITSKVSVTVSQILTQLVMTSGDGDLLTGATRPFAANALDQFKLPMTSAPTLTWAVSESGEVGSGSASSINSSTGVLTAGAYINAEAAVTAHSGSVYSNTVTVTVLNPAPTLYNNSFTVSENSGTTALNVLAGKTGGDPAAAAFLGILQQPRNGHISLHSGSPGYIDYTPDPEFAGTDTFIIDSYDANWSGGAATMKVTVSPSHPTPAAVANAPLVTVPLSAGTFTVDLSQYVADPDPNDPFTYSVTTSSDYTASLSGSLATITLSNTSSAFAGSPTLPFTVHETATTGWGSATLAVPLNVLRPDTGSSAMSIPTHLSTNYTWNNTSTGQIATLTVTSGAVNMTISGSAITISTYSGTPVVHIDYQGAWGTATPAISWSNSTSGTALFVSSQNPIGNITTAGALTVLAPAVTGTLTAASVAGDINGAGTSSGFTGAIAADAIANLIINRFAGTLTVPHIVSLYLESDLTAPLSVSGNIDLLDIHGSITKDGSVTSTAGNVHVLTTAGIIGSVSGYTGVTVQTGASFTFNDLFDGTFTGSGGFYSDLYVSNTLLLGNGYHFSFLADPALGDITGQIDVVTGNIDLTATGRVSSAKSHAIHTLSGNISISAGKDISETILTDDGDITSITTPRNLTATLTAGSATVSGNIGTLTAGGDIAATITAHGSIDNITAGGTIGGTINASDWIGDSSGHGIIAGEDITATIDPPDIKLMQAGRDITSTMSFGLLESLFAGRDFTGTTTTGGAIDALTVGEDYSASMTLSDNISDVYIGRVFKGNLISTGGTIGNILVGATTADGGLWANPQTVAGAILAPYSWSPATISAYGNIGTITVKTAPGEAGNAGEIQLATIISQHGNIGAITAVSGIIAAITANSSITGSITTPHGDISGTITATGGNIPLVAAPNGSITAALTSGDTIGPILAGHDITGTITALNNIATGTVSYNGGTLWGVRAKQGEISGNITSTSGSIGNITAGKDLSGDVEAHDNIGDIVAGAATSGNIDGTIIADTGSIGSITTFGNITQILDDDDDITETVDAATSIGDILVFGSINGDITAHSGSIASVTSWCDIIGDITAGATIGEVQASGDIIGNVESSVGSVLVATWGNVIDTISATKNAVLLAGNVLGVKATSSKGQVLALSSTVQGNFSGDKGVGISEYNDGNVRGISSPTASGRDLGEFLGAGAPTPPPLSVFSLMSPATLTAESNRAIFEYLENPDPLPTTLEEYKRLHDPLDLQRLYGNIFSPADYDAAVAAAGKFIPSRIGPAEPEFPTLTEWFGAALTRPGQFTGAVYRSLEADFTGNMSDKLQAEIEIDSVFHSAVLPNEWHDYNIAGNAGLMRFANTVTLHQSEWIDGQDHYYWDQLGGVQGTGWETATTYVSYIGAGATWTAGGLYAGSAIGITELGTVPLALVPQQAVLELWTLGATGSPFAYKALMSDSSKEIGAPSGVVSVNQLGCFCAGTLVLTTASLEPIEQIVVGRRIRTSPYDEPSGPELNPADHRLLRLVFRKDGHEFHMTFLRRASLLQGLGAGDTISLSILELQVEGNARVVSVEPCPAIEQGQGQIVTGAFVSQSHDVYLIKLSGLDAQVEVTGNHPIYCEDRQEFMPVRLLETGDRLRTRDGVAVIEAIQRKLGYWDVYNMEIGDVHQYYVTSKSVLVHNAGTNNVLSTFPGEFNSFGPPAGMTQGGALRIQQAISDILQFHQTAGNAEQAVEAARNLERIEFLIDRWYPGLLN